MCPESEVPLLRLAHITTSQKLSSTRAQENCQGVTFQSPRSRRHKNKGMKLGDMDRVTTATDPPAVAKSPAQLPNIYMGITPAKV